MTILRFHVLALFLAFVSCSKQAKAPPAADPVGQLRLLASKLDQPRQYIRFRQVRIDVRKSDSLVSPLTGEISGKYVPLTEDDIPGGRVNPDKISYFEEFTVSADYLGGEWVYAGCKSRMREASNFDWMDFTADRRTLSLSCSEPLDVMSMKHDKDAF
jgi:hypothetical protein